MKIKISVTQRDITGYHETILNKTSQTLTDCAVARACKRNVKIKPIFGYVGCVFLHLRGVPTITLPRKVADNIYDICCMIPVKPFKFTIEVPDNVL